MVVRVWRWRMAAAGGGQGHWDELQVVVVVWREDSSSKEQSRPRRTTRPLPRVPCPDPLCSEPCPGEQGLCVSPRLGWDQLGAGPRFAALSLCQDGEGSLRVAGGVTAVGAVPAVGLGRVRSGRWPLLGVGTCGDPCRVWGCLERCFPCRVGAVLCKTLNTRIPGGGGIPQGPCHGVPLRDSCMVGWGFLG